jgi:hypothetical protein
LQIIRDFLIDRDTACPPGWRIGSALDVPWVEFDSGEQAADSAHVVIAITSNLVAHAVECEQPIFEWFEGRHDSFEREFRTFFVGPKVWRDHAIGAEDNHEALLVRSGCCSE